LTYKGQRLCRDGYRLFAGWARELRQAPPPQCERIHARNEKFPHLNIVSLAKVLDLAPHGQDSADDIVGDAAK
jgi:hypothetical protein